MWYENPSLRLVFAAVIVIVGAVVIATTGDSWAVKWIAALVSLELAARLAFGGRSGS
jgi:hypothetical protein